MADGRRPDNPRGWLITVASRRLTDLLRSEQARRRREDTAATWTLPDAPAGRRLPTASRRRSDDSLILLFLCCHPSLSPASQIALTLRAVGGLTTVEIARAFLVPESTMTRRISRAKQRIKDSGTRSACPPRRTRAAARSGAARALPDLQRGLRQHIGPDLQRTELSAEAIRLARMRPSAAARRLRGPGLLALMVLTDARRPARTGPDGR